MKVCYVTHLPNLTGASQSLLDILSGLKNTDIELIVLLGKRGPLEDELKKRNVKYQIISYSSEIREKKLWKNCIKKIKNFIAIKRIMKFFERERIDLVHNNSLLVRVGMEAAYRSGIPYICHIREFVYEDHNILLLEEKRQYFLMEQSTVAISISNAVCDKFKKIAPNSNFKVIADGIDVAKYYQEKHEIFKDKVVNLILPGRIAPGKGQIDAIKAVEALYSRGYKNIILKIVGGVGDQKYADGIREYIEIHNLTQVEIIDFTDLRKLRRQSDIGLVCSSAEALGRVTIESMLSGCLTIGAAAGATVEIIKDGENGLLYEQGDFIDLADKIVYAMENVYLMREIALKGQKYAIETYDYEKYNEQLVAIYKSISNV